MASLKLTAALAVIAVCAAASAATTAAGVGYWAEDCRTQAKYFENCLRLGYGESCCTGVVADQKCLCEVERDAEIHCVPKRSCPRNGVAKAVRLAEMNLSCMKKLKCKPA